MTKPFSPQLASLLMGRNWYQADLITIAGGNLGSNILRYTSGDQDIIGSDGQRFTSGGATGPYFERQSSSSTKAHWKIGIEVDTYSLDIIPGTALLFGTPFMMAAHNGVFDGAEITIDRAYMPLGAYGDTRRGLLRIFVGRVATIDIGRIFMTLSINSHLELLNLQLPHNLYSPGCINNLGDASCTVNINSFATTGTITAGSNNSTMNCTLNGGPFNPGAFDLGKVIFTSGNLNGLVGTIKTCVVSAPQVFQLMGYMAAAPGVGDGFQLYYGCNKSFTDANGCPKFANQPHFRGFPIIPQPTQAV